MRARVHTHFLTSYNGRTSMRTALAALLRERLLGDRVACARAAAAYRCCLRLCGLECVRTLEPRVDAFRAPGGHAARHGPRAPLFTRIPFTVPIPIPIPFRFIGGGLGCGGAAGGGGGES